MSTLQSSLKQEYTHILKDSNITTYYQPIISLKNSEVLGYEALSRGPVNSYFHSPEKLFDFAKKINKVWELDLLCRLNAIKKAKGIIDNKLLFINIDSDIINDPLFRKGFTKEFLDNHNIDSSHVIFEITEHTAVADYKMFNEVLENYRQQGYRIALDDVGEGYSGLRLMTEVRPDFIKIDMSLIRNIDKDMMKKELLKSFQRFAKITNIHLVAEGIETYDELKTLIEIGIPYGQGYYLQRPSKEFAALPITIVDQIQYLNQIKTKVQQDPKSLTLGSLMRCDSPLQYSDACGKANNLFSESYNLQGIPILKGNEPIGLIMRHKFYYQMQKNNAKPHFFSRSLAWIMDHSPLILDHSFNIQEAANMAISREESRVYDYIIVTTENNYKGIIPIAFLLDALSQMNYTAVQENI